MYWLISIPYSPLFTNDILDWLDNLSKDEYRIHRSNWCITQMELYSEENVNLFRLNFTGKYGDNKYFYIKQILPVVNRMNHTKYVGTL